MYAVVYGYGVVLLLKYGSSMSPIPFLFALAFLCPSPPLLVFFLWLSCTCRSCRFHTQSGLCSTIKVVDPGVRGCVLWRQSDESCLCSTMKMVVPASVVVFVETFRRESCSEARRLLQRSRTWQIGRLAEFRIFQGFRKTLWKSSPKLRGPRLTEQNLRAELSSNGSDPELRCEGLTPQNLHAELPSNGSARAFQGPGSEPHLSDETPKFSGPEVCTQQTLGVRHSVSQAAQQPQRTSSVSPHQRISPTASSCDRAALLCNLHFDYGVEQAYSAAARIQPRRSSQGALFLWIPSGIRLHGVSKRLEAPPAVPLERVDRYPFFSVLLSKKAQR